MAKVVAQLPTANTTRSPVVLSPFERFLKARQRPIPITVRLFHSSILQVNAIDYLLGLLPRSTILTLRVVCSTTKEWVHGEVHNLLTALHVTCPLPQFSSRFSKKMLCSLAPNCRQLSIRLLPSAKQIHVGSIQSPSHAREILNIVSKFESLRIDAPLTDAFYPLFSLRLALEQAMMESLTELHIRQLTIPGLLGIRWGGFDAFVDATWMGKKFWRGISSFRIGMTTDWLAWAHRTIDYEVDEEQRGRLKKQRDIYRQSIQILHDWFFHFSLTSNMSRICFEWMGAKGPNPFLLDEEVIKEHGGEWFSAPAIAWKGVKEVWLGGVTVSTFDVTTLKLRFDGLEKLMVWEELADSTMFGTVRAMEGRDWLDIDLIDDLQRPMDVRMPERTREPFQRGEAEVLEESHERMSSGDDGGDSMICPLILDPMW